MKKDPSLPLATAIGGVSLAFTELETALRECCIALVARHGVEPMIGDVLVRHHDTAELAAVLVDLVGARKGDHQVADVVGDIAADVRRLVRQRTYIDAKGPGHIPVSTYNNLRSDARDTLSTILALTEYLHMGEDATAGFTPAPAADNVVVLRPELRIVT